MVCCALISIVLASLFWPIRFIIAKFKPVQTPPLMWQLDSAGQSEIKPPSFSLSARVKSVGYAVSGIGFVIRNEHNARIHIAAAIVVFAVGIYYQISTSDWLILVLAIVGVWFAETINTAFEYLCDVVSPQKNEAVRHAKDIAAGAVLITAMGAALVGIIVLFPYVFSGQIANQTYADFLEALADNMCMAS